MAEREYLKQGVDRVLSGKIRLISRVKQCEFPNKGDSRKYEDDIAVLGIELIDRRTKG